jgi:hypothetical protein
MNVNDTFWLPAGRVVWQRHFKWKHVYPLPRFSIAFFIAIVRAFGKNLLASVADLIELAGVVEENVEIWTIRQALEADDT